MSAPDRGPFTADQLKDGDRYELTRGHPVRVAPAGGRHGREHLVGAISIATDPEATEVGIDVGYSPDGQTLRAPDLAVGNVPNAPGWVAGAPRLAIEYADRGTDEQDLLTKIDELLQAGTEWVWVVRLTGPRRVDVHSRARGPFTVGEGGTLEAPGALSQPLPVEALFSIDRANEVALRNLLARYGEAVLSSAREEGRAEGREQGREQGREEGRTAGLRAAIERLCTKWNIALGEEQRSALASADGAALERLYDVLLDTRRFP